MTTALASSSAGLEHAPQRRLHAEQRKHFGRHRRDRETPRLSAADQVHRIVGERAHAVERGAHRLEVAIVRGRQLVHAAPAAARARALAQPHQGVRIGERQRAEQHEIRDRERGGVGADAKRGDQDGGQRKSARAVQGASGVAQILLQDVPMGGRCVHDDLLETQLYPQCTQLDGAVSAWLAGWLAKMAATTA